MGRCLGCYTEALSSACAASASVEGRVSTQSRPSTFRRCYAPSAQGYGHYDSAANTASPISLVDIVPPRSGERAPAASALATAASIRSAIAGMLSE